MPVSVETRQAVKRLAIPLLGFGQQKSRRLAGCVLASVILMGSATPEEPISGYQSPVNPADVYLDAIDDIEADYGPYATELSDLYVGLGQTLFDLGEYERARDAFNRGVMVQRVNLGPNSPEQTNQLYVLANLEFMMGEWDVADEILENIYFINSSHYGPDSVEMLPVLKRIYSWYLVTRPPGADGSRFQDYQRMIDITEELVRVSEVSLGELSAEAASAHRQNGEAQFQMALYRRGYEFSLNRDRYLAMSDETLFSPDRTGLSIDQYLQEGRRSFDRYEEALWMSQTVTPEEYADALADMGDWYLLAEKYRKSWNMYEQGYKVLAEGKGTAELAAQYMSQPRPMHFVLDPSEALLDENQPNTEHSGLDISMTVTGSGKLRAIGIRDVPEGMTRDQIREIERQVRRIPFRPAMKDGKIVTTKDFIWRYKMAPRTVQVAPEEEDAS